MTGQSDQLLQVPTGVLLVTVSEFAGTDWRSIAESIPVPAGLTQDDPDPFFVTLPVCSVGATSRGKEKLIYGKAANTQIVEQIHAKRPEGIWGHMRDDEVDTRYDKPDVMAVGARMDEQGVTWAKFYVMPYATDTRDYYRVKMMLNAKAGVSLWGQAWANPATREVTRLDLKKIDIADPERVGLSVAAAVPIITRHMGGDGDDDTGDAETPPDDTDGEYNLMEELQVKFAEMAGVLGVSQEQVVEKVRALNATASVTVKIAEMLDAKPDGVVDAVKSLQNRAALVSEMQQVLGEDVTEAILVQRVSEMAVELNTFRQTAKVARVKGLIDGSAEDAEEPLVKLEDLRPVVVAHMGPEDGWPDDDQAIADAVKTILEKPQVKNLAEMIVKAKGGPAAALGASDKGDGQPPSDEDINKRAEEMAASTGVTSPH